MREAVGGDVVVQQEPAPLSRHLRVHEERGHTVLEFRGEIDIAAAAEIEPHLDRATADPDVRVVIDLSLVEFLDCSGLRLLYRARSRVLDRDGQAAPGLHAPAHPEDHAGDRSDPAAAPAALAGRGPGAARGHVRLVMTAGRRLVMTAGRRLVMTASLRAHPAVDPHDLPVMRSGARRTGH